MVRDVGKLCLHEGTSCKQYDLEVELTSTCSLFLELQFAMGEWLGKHCLHCNWFKTCFQLFRSISKQRDVIEFLIHRNESSIGIH